MRLGQLSRKLDLSTSKIVTFIEKEFDVTIKDHPNVKIDDSFLERIEAEFKVETPTTPDVTKNKETTPAHTETSNTPTEPKEAEASTEDTPVSTEEKQPSVVSAANSTEEMNEANNEDDAEVELIKAPKPELKQIKVLRKIELPQTKKIVQEEQENASATAPANIEKELATLEKELKESIERPAPVKKKTYKRPNKPMKKKKSVEEILAEKKKRAEQERIAEEKRKEKQAAYEKKKRKEHYQAQVAKTNPKKKKKKKKEQEVATQSKQEQRIAQENAPKTWVGKLIKWFQTS